MGERPSRFGDDREVKKNALKNNRLGDEASRGSGDNPVENGEMYPPRYAAIYSLTPVVPVTPTEASLVRKPERYRKHYGNPVEATLSGMRKKDVGV